jgi:hypothetical protein
MAHRFPVKFDGAEHVAMVGHRHSRLLQRLDALKKLVNFIGAVE